MTTTYTAQCPDGPQVQRTSANRTYPHVVVAAPADPATYAAWLRSKATTLRADADTLDAAAQRGDVRRVQRSTIYHDPESMNAYEAVLQGSATTTSPYDLSRRCNVHDVGETLADRAKERGLEVLGTREGYSGIEWVQVRVRDEVLAYARETAARYRADADYLDAEAALVEATGHVEGRDGEWATLRWTSRRDLADAYVAGEFAGYAPMGRRLLVLDTVATEGRMRKAKAAR